MAAEIDEALCIRQWEWSETSQTVALFTRDHGVVRALAKGSRRPRGAFSGGIELLSVAEIGLIARPQSELALLTAWDLRRTFPGLRNALGAYNAGMYIAEMILQFVRDHDAHPALYARTLESLDGLSLPEAVPEAVLGFQWALLGECGVRPETEVDVRTGEPLAVQGEYLFDPGLGGFSAGRGETGGGAEGGGVVWGVRAETLGLLRGLGDAAGTTGVQASTVDRANRLLASYARYVLGYQTPAMGVLFGDRLAR